MCDEWEGQGEKEKEKEREAEKTEGEERKTASKIRNLFYDSPKNSHETRNYFAIMKQEFSGDLLPRPSFRWS